MVKYRAVYQYIDQYYELYCDGFSELNDSGLNYGLSIKPPSNYSADSWHELTLIEQTKLIDSFYPDIAEEAQKILNWFGDRQIIIIDDDEENRTVIDILR